MAIERHPVLPSRAQLSEQGGLPSNALEGFLDSEVYNLLNEAGAYWKEGKDEEGNTIWRLLDKDGIPLAIPSRAVDEEE